MAGIHGRHEVMRRRVEQLETDVERLRAIVDLWIDRVNGHSDWPDALNMSQVCRLLGCSVHKFYEWKHSGVLPDPIYMPGGKEKWWLADILHFVAKRNPKTERAIRVFRRSRDTRSK